MKVPGILYRNMHVRFTTQMGEKLCICWTVFSLFYDSIFGQLMISGIGHIPYGKYFTELYCTSDIKHLSDFSIRSTFDAKLPDVNVTRGTFILVSNNVKNLHSFFGSSYKYYFGYPTKSYVSMLFGDDCIALLNSSTKSVIDSYGPISKSGHTKDRCKKDYSYNLGWVKRKNCTMPLTDDWLISRNTLKGCSTNEGCSDPFELRSSGCYVKTGKFSDENDNSCFMRVRKRFDLINKYSIR